jgi:hypothetical protein
MIDVDIHYARTRSGLLGERKFVIESRTQVWDILGATLTQVRSPNLT